LKRKLIVLNIGLVVLTVAVCWRLRVQWQAAREHEKIVLVNNRPKPAAAAPYVPPAPPQPIVAAQYLEVATKDLFAKDRNSIVINDPPPPPPPPKPMPALPIVKGILNLDGVTAIMMEGNKGPQKEVKPGDQIGEFKLLAINNQEIVLEWDGQEVRRRVEELFDRSIPEATPPPATGPAVQAQSAPAKPAMQVKAGPGTDVGGGRKACVPGDSSPVGTVVDGMRKVGYDTPFGQACAWEVAK
jgi:hypothetical protein